MAKQTSYNAGIYVRLSQEDMRAGESLSIENQKLILTKYVREQGWNLVADTAEPIFAVLLCRNFWQMHSPAESTSLSSKT